MLYKLLLLHKLLIITTHLVLSVLEFSVYERRHASKTSKCRYNSTAGHEYIVMSIDVCCYLVGKLEPMRSD
jgi:hypothetical protein